jgi:hypothetical protein
MHTIETLLEEMNKKMLEGVDVSPKQFLDYASELAMLLFGLDNELVLAEMEVNKKMADYLKTGETYAKSKTLVQGMDEYGRLLVLKARRKQAEQFIQLAKKRVDDSRYQNL